MQERATNDNRKTMAHVAYALLVLPSGLTTVAGLVLAYVMRSSADGSWVDSHFRRQIRTFWTAFAAGLVVWALAFVFVGAHLFAGHPGDPAAGVAGAMGGATLLLLLFVAVGVVYLWRIVTGWLALARGDAG